MSTPNPSRARTGRRGVLNGTLPRLGLPGSRAAALHDAEHEDAHVASSARHLHRFAVLRWIGTVGTLLIAVGALGAGALPVVANPYVHAPLGSLMSRMLQTSSIVVFVGVALMVVSWVLMAPVVGATRSAITVPLGHVKRTFVAWTLPLLVTAPLFTQDIYSYLAQGSIVAQGMDPYAAGPVELLGTENHLARSVPFIWAQSPSPYGPVALGLAAAISVLTADNIMLGVIAHRLVSITGLVAASWAVSRLARRCNVSPVTALWLGILNPLTILHLVGGIHNESILLGLLLVGLEVALRGISRLERGRRRSGWALTLLSAALITCAGLVKVTGFLGLGFTGMALAAYFARGGVNKWASILAAGLVKTLALVVTVAVASAVTGIGLGWVTGQGGAATIRSWMSMTTDLGVVFGFLGMLLDLGDHTEAALGITRTVGLAVAAGFIVRMLFATYDGRIHPVGGLGVGTLVLVVLFPVVHPWYLLWAIVPMAAWANRMFFRVVVVVYSALMSFTVLPRGLALPPDTVVTIYLGAIVSALTILAAGWFLLRKLRWIP
ncbi:polyprenol phosphomannose-dependent alpha 1,6 mannosyltransferase MptB [Corynebacterium guangdongense]|uniref:Alpha-1,6-mannosyltransferase n=1 Tax=Corynebacterium guangdongense TaxID=1783348 RepID=A0ABU1ZYA9_9CORY|nr:polyprenol phosphomannose-dependent alpha 1,6 mannosyltransferase MptB [Corynebacterium guangdongense]MDR7329383.1 alpha-1,6-mannosyltransferase [Corynebacterium guangdongense]WJZ17948.1 hypothetical protein CGUA_06895 [Corynebacterium guangdongense]